MTTSSIEKAEVTGVSEWCTTGDAELVDSKDGARFQLLSTATADRLRDRLLAAQQSWEEERRRLTAERDEALTEAAKPEPVRWAGYRQALEERDVLRLRLDSIACHCDFRHPSSDPHEPGDHHSPECRMYVGDYWTKLNESNRALRLRLEKVERLGEALATSREQLHVRRTTGEREALQAWRNRDQA